ncbi:MAG: hypothetical protein RIT15_203 [Pseudomonadota bacterium]|jgi:uncharacterized MAPEG superfamily protein
MMPTFQHFTIAYGCVLFMAILPIICAGLAKRSGFGKPRREGGYDNIDPRAWLDKQTGFAARANAAQANTFEALPFFFAAVIIAHQLGAIQVRLDILALIFVLLRVLYVMMYVAGIANLRSLIWTAAFAVNVGILFLGVR